MSLAEHHRSMAADERRISRWVRSAAFGAILATAACDQRNLAVISLDEVPSSATATTAYYRLDGGEWKSVLPQRGLRQFGIELPKGRSAALETRVFAYDKQIPCIHGSAVGETQLDGGSIRELSLPVSVSTDRCTAAAEPADFPQGKLAVWAGAANDIWIAGAGGKIVRWDGARYATVPLPAALAAAPPDWNAIWGDPTTVWIAGTKSAVVRYTNGALSVVPMLPPLVRSTDWRAIAPADPEFGPLLFAGSNRVIGFTTPDLPGIGQLDFSCAGSNPPGDLTSVACGFSGTTYRCYFVTDGGGIAALQSNTGGMAACRGLSSPTTRPLHDVFVGLNIPGQVFDIRIVGQGGTAWRASAPINMAGDPNFMAASANYAPFIPATARVDLRRIGGTGLDDLWIVGQGGLLLRWPNSAIGTPPPMPFPQSPTGVTADLSSLSGFPSGLVFGGANKTLGYSGPLFTPQIR